MKQMVRFYLKPLGLYFGTLAGLGLLILAGGAIFGLEETMFGVYARIFPLWPVWISALLANNVSAYLNLGLRFGGCRRTSFWGIQLLFLAEAVGGVAVGAVFIRLLGRLGGAGMEGLAPLLLNPYFFLLFGAMIELSCQATARVALIPAGRGRGIWIALVNVFDLAFGVAGTLLAVLGGVPALRVWRFLLLAICLAGAAAFGIWNHYSIQKAVVR